MYLMVKLCSPEDISKQHLLAKKMERISFRLSDSVQGSYLTEVEYEAQTMETVALLA
jgi:hypothetical protein